jgi:hypothetical protein
VCRQSSRQAEPDPLKEGRTEVTDRDFNRALDELLGHAAALTRILLGHSEPGEQAGAPARNGRDWRNADAACPLTNSRAS